MYAIIQDSGQQLKVEEGQELDVDYRELETGSELKFDRVLAVSLPESIKLGQPLLEGASVTAVVVGVVQGPKVFIQKARRRKNFRRRTGHRQMYIRVKISKIDVAQ
jgi:large subunit ribosomal protein L21